MRVRPRGWWIALACALLLAAAGLALALGARRADRDLHRAESRLAALQAALAAGRAAQAQDLLVALQQDAESADGSTHGPLWSVAAHLPFVGSSVAQTSTLTRAVRTVGDEVLPPLVSAVAALRPVLHGEGGSVDLAAVRRTVPDVEAALARLLPVDRTLDALPAHAAVGPVDRARARLTSRVDGLTKGLSDLVAAVRVAPAMLGADGPRHYFVGFQNNAESRGTGGLLGAYALLTADHGRIHVDKVGSDADLDGLPPPKVDLGPDFDALYGRDARLWQNSNMSPTFPYAARLWLDMWRQHTGQRLDGALATDPVALGYLLAGTGPVAVPDGSAVTAANVVAETEQVAYTRYAGDQAARKLFLVGVARAVLTRVLGPDAPSRADLVRAVARAASQRRFLVYSAHPEEEAVLDGTTVAGDLPARAGPFAFLVVNNTAGNKIDYYLHRSMSYDVWACHHGARDSTVTVQLRTDVPTLDLPRYVVGRLDRRGPPGSTSLLVAVYTAEGAALRSATLDGRRVAVYQGRERGHPVFLLPLELARGQLRTLVLNLVEPAVPGPPVVPVQPLALPQATTVRADACS